MNTLDANDKRGLFAKYQPVYAAHAVVTLPVEAEHKKPFVRHPQCFGLPASRKVAAKFPDANAFGFWAGHRNKLSVLDVDDTDERVLADAFSRHGGTPLVVRTASKKFHAYYRHGGERRRIRPWRDLPIDLLGAGLCLAPPSVTGKGAYEIIAGSLDDLDRLPIMRGLDSEFYQRSESSPKNMVSRTVEPGQRNQLAIPPLHARVSPRRVLRCIT